MNDPRSSNQRRPAGVPVARKTQRFLRRLPIKWKLVGINLALALATLAIVFIGTTVSSRAEFERTIERDMRILADVVGGNSRAALLFDDADAAADILAELRANGNITHAILYDADGRRFAEYRRPGFTPGPPLAPKETTVFDGNEFLLVRDIYSDNQRIGSIYLAKELNQWEQTLRNLLLVFAALTVVSIGVIFVLAIFFQRVITNPINSLVATARAVSKNRDYSVRVPKTTDDELGTLVDGFNTMLREIQLRDAELRASHALLERRVAERTAQLQNLNKELESFSYSVSHDLRAPLRAIDGFGSILVAEHGDALDKRGKATLERIRRAAQNMGSLIDDLLKLSRVTRAELTVQEVDLSAQVAAIAAALRDQEPERQVQFVIAQGLTIRADPNLMRVALENLLGNAWKFTSGREDARIEFGVATENGLTTYFVRDNGAGFDPAYTGKLFTAFQRLHDASEFPGSGIGLATVQRIIRRHGGRVRAEGTVGGGATFYFTVGDEVRDG